MSSTILENPEVKTDDGTITKGAWKVILYNDEYHSFDYITQLLTDCVNIDTNKAQELTKNIHNKGREIVFAGEQETAEHYYDLIHNYPQEERLGNGFPKVKVELES